MKKKPIINSNQDPSYRIVQAFPDVSVFYFILMDRLQMLLERYFFEDKSTIFLNALPREMTQKYPRSFEGTEKLLIYAGIDRQRELLEGNLKGLIPGLNKHWDYLDQNNLSSSSETVSSKLFAEAANNDLELSDLKIGELKMYFNRILEPSDQMLPSKNKIAEFSILSHYFDVQEDCYLSLPLIQFGEFDGVAHIILTKKDVKKVIRQRKNGEIIHDYNFIGNIIKAFSSEYEALILDWDLVGENMQKTTLLRYIFDNKHFKSINKNPILSELNYPEYYKKFAAYFKLRFNQSDSVPERFYSSNLKVAIISILVDSYAHNVSAHSLTALNWWFKQRIKSLDARKIDYRKMEEKLAKIIDDDILYDSENYKTVMKYINQVQQYVKPQLNKEQLSENSTAVVDYHGPLDRELQPLINFLAEKGAFWSGLTRDFNFGGEINNLFDILWTDFINNPLYLGTIAKTEGITRLNFKIFFMKPETEASEQDRYLSRSHVDFSGIFASIDIKNAFPIDEKGPSGLFTLTTDPENGETVQILHGNNLELSQRSFFVQPGAQYETIKKALKDLTIYLPGGVVGKHALFTIFENEIRNVKHYSGLELKKIQEEGLTLALSIQEKDVYHEDKLRELYKIGFWLQIPTQLRQPDSIDDSPFILERRYKALLEPIMATSTFTPQLGGNFQDKICASMLFNNIFKHVQNGDTNAFRPKKEEDTDRDKKYYPWLTPATALVESPFEDFELNREHFPNDEEFKAIDFESIYPHADGVGYLKKHFFLWKGDFLVKPSRQNQLEWDNLSRFKIIQITDSEATSMLLKQSARKEGVIRIISNQNAALTDVEAYQKWLQHWLGTQSKSFAFKELKSAGHKEPRRFYNYDGPTGSVQLADHATSPNEAEFLFAHKGKSDSLEIIRYRTHGIFKSHFDSQMVSELEEDQKRIRWIELIETIETQVCIFDNRVRQRIDLKKERENSFAEQLKLVVREEAPPVWEAANSAWTGPWEEAVKHIIPNCHFLVLHLTYIDKILQTKYANLAGEDLRSMQDSSIGFFIEKELLPAIEQNGQIRDNFIFVITTGRGRTEWWEKMIQTKYQKFQNFTTFRPVESIIANMETAISKEDDFELKYGLIKVLFGS